MVLTGAQVIMECLLEQGVDTVFGYPGGSVLNIYDALYEYRDRINHIRTAHEQGRGPCRGWLCAVQRQNGRLHCHFGPRRDESRDGHCNRIYGLRPSGGHHRQRQFGPVGFG